MGLHTVERQLCDQNQEHHKTLWAEKSDKENIQATSIVVKDLAGPNCNICIIHVRGLLGPAES